MIAVALVLLCVGLLWLALALAIGLLAQGFSALMRRAPAIRGLRVRWAMRRFDQRVRTALEDWTRRPNEPAT